MQCSKVEKVQMNALQVILGAEGSSYKANLLRLELDTLSVRRDAQIKKFAISTFHDPKFRCWYKSSPPPSRNTRLNSVAVEDLDGGFTTVLKPPRLLVPSGKSARIDTMPLSVYTKVLNNLFDTEWSEVGLPPIASCVYKHNIHLSQLYCTTTTTGDMLRATHQSPPPPTPACPPSLCSSPSRSSNPHVQVQLDIAPSVNDCSPEPVNDIEVVNDDQNDDNLLPINVTF